MKQNNPLILIGGTSHTGKTTLGNHIARAKGIRLVSTDSLARHPGRPWRNDDTELPERVRQHYRDFSPQQLLHEVIGHYRSLYATASSLLQRLNREGGGVMEGSMVTPEFVTKLTMPITEIHWLSESESALEQRIYCESNYTDRTQEEQDLIDKFSLRSVHFDQLVQKQLRDPRFTDKFKL